MDDLLAARAQMAMSLGFHIVFAVVGIGMPLFMVLAEARWLRTRDEAYLALARRWAKGTAILFAVGAVSGTVLSFELGLLWPSFMELAGPVIGMPFSLEGFAFFLEAIFLGLYLYGWKRLGPRLHLFAGAMVLLCGTLSGVFVVSANAWMNTPAGFTLDAAGRVIAVDIWAAMWNPAAAAQILHMTLAAFLSVAIAVAGIHAAALRRAPNNRFHRHAYRLGLWVAGIAAVLQIASGDYAAKVVAATQPAKLAALEGQWETTRSAPLRIGGWPDEAREETTWALEIPYGLSFLAFGDPDAEVLGLKAFPRADRPPVAPVHIAFQIMVGAGTALAGLGFLAAFLAVRRRRLPDAPWFLRLVALAAPLGFVATEAGWVVTEVGRQPWVIHGVLRTAEAVSPMPGLIVPFIGFTVLYLFLGAVVVVALRRHIAASPELAGGESPLAPRNRGTSDVR